MNDNDTGFYIDSSNYIRYVNGGPDDNAFYLNGKHIHGPRNSGYFWLEGNEFWSNAGDTGFRLMPDRKIFGPSSHLPWLTNP